MARIIPERGGADVAAIAERLLALLPPRWENRADPFVGAIGKTSRWSPLVPAVLIVLIVMAMVFVFRRTPHSDAGWPETTAAPPVADKVDPRTMRAVSRPRKR